MPTVRFRSYTANVLLFLSNSNSRVSGDSLISFAKPRGKRLLGAFESSYKRKTYQDRSFKLKPRGSAIQYFYSSLGMARFSFKWSSIIALSLWLVINDFSAEEKNNVEVLERPSSNIITLKWEGIGCTDLIRYFDDSAILQECFCESLI